MIITLNSEDAVVIVRPRIFARYDVAFSDHVLVLSDFRTKTEKKYRLFSFRNKTFMKISSLQLQEMKL